MSTAHLVRPATAQPGRLFPLLFACFFLSGATALGFEVLWARYFSLFIGASTYAHTIVLATYMGGLALGNALFGRIADRTRSPVRLYGLLELGVGVLCLGFPWLFDALTGVYLSIATGFGFGSPANLPLKLVLSVLSILAPTVLMGGTLPVLARALVRGQGDVGSRIGQLYFVNTGGAVAGSLITGFMFIPTLGLQRSTLMLAAFNILIGLMFLAIAREEAVAPEQAQETLGAPVYDRRQVRWTLVAIGLSGAASMTYELVWTRLLSLVLDSSVHSFTLMLVTFIGGISLGGLVASRLLRETDGPAPDALRMLAWAEIGVFASIVAMLPLYERLPFAFNVMASLFGRSPEAYPLFLGVKVLVSVALMLIPTVLIGTTLPLASRIVVHGAHDVGRGVGNTFSVNTLGTLVGASLTGLLLIPTLGLQGTLEVALAVSAGLGLLLLTLARGTTRRQLGATACAVMGVAVIYSVAIPTWDQGMLHAGLYRRRDIVAMDYDALIGQRDRLEVLFHEDGVDTSVAVMRHRDTDVLYLKVNGKTDAGTGNDMTTQLWLGHLPMLLHRDPRDVLVIGLGSGITAGAVLRHPAERLDQVELSPAVVRASRFFAEANHGAMDDPRMALHVGDAKELFKLAPDRRWDAIISEPSNPWISGVGNLFTIEYFREARAHLAPGGMMVQWVHLYEMNDDVLRIVLDTFGAVFPHVTVWQCNSADILVIGGSEPLAVDMERLARRLADQGVASDLARDGMVDPVTHPLQVLAMQMLSDATFREWFPGRPPLNEDDCPLLEYEAPRAFFLGSEAKVLRRIDERRRSVATSDLLLAQQARQAPLTDSELALLREHHLRRGSDYDRPLLASILAEEHRRAESPATLERLLQLGDPASARSVLWKRVQQGRGISEGAIVELARDEVARLSAETSIYGSPGPRGAAVLQLLAAAERIGGPNLAPLLDQAADVLMRRGEAPEARAVLEELRALEEQSPGGAPTVDRAEVLFRIALLALQAGDQSGAKAALRAAIAADPEHWPSLQALFRTDHGA